MSRAYRQSSSSAPLLVPAVIALIVFWALLLMGCASMPIKAKVSAGHQILRDAVVAFDETERALCRPDPVTPSHCTAVPAVVTDVQHQAISKTLVKVFETDKTLSAAIIAWRAGDPIPADVPTLVADTIEAFNVAASFAPSNSPLVAQARAVLIQVAALVALFGGL